MKNASVFIFLFLFVPAFAVDEQSKQSSNVIIDIPYNVQRPKSPVIIKSDKDYTKNPQDVKHLPWSMTEKRIEYDHNGQAQFTPYALNDLNLQY